MGFINQLITGGHHLVIISSKKSPFFLLRQGAVSMSSTATWKPTLPGHEKDRPKNDGTAWDGASISGILLGPWWPWSSPGMKFFDSHGIGCDDNKSPRKLGLNQQNTVDHSRI